ncbi:MAG: MFS transporter [Burkholderia sp.]
MSNAIRHRPDARLIMLLGALAACRPIGTDMYLPSMPSVAESLGTSASAVQWTLTSFLSGFSLGMLLYGPLSDSLGCRPVLLGGIVLFTVAGAGRFVAPSIGSLIVLRFLQALGAGAASVLSRAIAHEPADAAKVLSMVAIVTSVGPLLAPLLGGQILRFAGWRMVCVVLTLFGIGCTIAAFLKVPETGPKERRKSSAILQSFMAYGRILRDPVAWGTLTGMVAPGVIGDAASIDALAAMADHGDAYVLGDGAGHAYGAYVITGLEERQCYHTADGIPRRIDVTLTIERVDDEALQQTPDAPYDDPDEDDAGGDNTNDKEA